MNAERQITFVFSSHDPQVIERGRKLLLMKDGAIDREDIRTENR